MVALTEPSLIHYNTARQSLTFIRLHYLGVTEVSKAYCMCLFTFRVLYCRLVCLQSKHQRSSTPCTAAGGPTVAFIGWCVDFKHILRRAVKSRTKSETFYQPGKPGNCLQFPMKAIESCMQFQQIPGTVARRRSSQE